MSLDLVNTSTFGTRVGFAGCLQMWLLVMRRTQWLPGKSKSALHTSSLSFQNTGDLTAWGDSGKALIEEALNWALKDGQDFDR